MNALLPLLLLLCTMQRGSSHLLSAYFHLLTTAGSNSAEDWPQTVDASSSSSSSRNARNEDARRLFNERLETEGAAAGRPAGAPAAGPTVAGENLLRCLQSYFHTNPPVCSL
jgi:hypothetical protein